MSKAERLQANFLQQNITLLRIYSGYCVLLCLVLLATFLLLDRNPLVGAHRPVLFLYTLCGYLLLKIFSLSVVLPRYRHLGKQQLFIYFLIDIAALTLFVDSSGGISNGLGLLLVVMVAASSIVLHGQIATLVAAMATLAILTDTLLLIDAGRLGSNSLLPAGLLGFTLFSTSFFIQYLSKVLRRSQEQATKSAADVDKLQLINQQIIQKMRTGILVVDVNGDIKMANQAAGQLLGGAALQPEYQANGLPRMHPLLRNQLKQWQRDSQYQPPPFKSNDSGPELQANFSALTSESEADTLIFLEDNRLVASRAQQMKLASLGRLTASIAHEIRNPLGAISHAAQLLAESEALDRADLRLCEIIGKHSLRMNQVIENVLQLSRRKAPNLAKLHLNSWLAHFIHDYISTVDPAAGIELIDSERDFTVTVDSSQLRQVLSNLFDNGLRYSKQACGEPRLSLRLGVDPNSDLPVLDIIDQGAAIDAQAQQQLFEPFYTTESKGTGLGLYICRELCEANSIQLGYRASSDGHSCFRLTFPHPNRRTPHSAITEQEFH